MIYLNRRKLMGVTLGASSLLASSMKAQANFAGDVELRGQVDRLERLPTLGSDSRELFRTSMRRFVNSDLNRAANQRALAIFEEAGVNLSDDMPIDDVIGLLKGDPVLMNHLHAFLNVQQSMWTDLRDTFHSDADRYLEEMEKAESSGPGLLELNPQLEIPDYAAWEIHNQPGGYVGDAFAGHMYHYGTNNFFVHANDQDGVARTWVDTVPVPADGKVRRCLDMGTSVGQSALMLKDRFTDAEVWGIDVGGPMVRYAHLRAVDLGVDIKFSQRLAEDTHFPTGHFDIATAFLLFHEVDIQAAKSIIKEIYRVLRPGGVFLSTEGSFLLSRPKRNAYSRWRLWWNDQWCSEVHYLPYTTFDYEGAFRKEGFDIGVAESPRGRKFMTAIKPA
jgi:ubiquinone/menaquinone biosynthesis C-methylase UbiE